MRQISIPEATRRAYLAHRAEGMPAHIALQWVRSAAQQGQKYPFLAKLNYMGCKGTVGAFSVEVDIKHDWDARLGEDDVTGVFTDEYTKGCIKARPGSDYKWYRPSNYTLNHAMADYSAAGMSKGAARQAYAKRVRAEMADDAERTWYGVEVTLTVAGRLVAQESLWGIDVIPSSSYDAMAYFRQVASELIDQAMDEARRTIPTELQRIIAQAAALAALLTETPEAA